MANLGKVLFKGMLPGNRPLEQITAFTPRGTTPVGSGTYWPFDPMPLAQVLRYWWQAISIDINVVGDRGSVSTSRTGGPTRTVNERIGASSADNAYGIVGSFSGFAGLVQDGQTPNPVPPFTKDPSGYTRSFGAHMTNHKLTPTVVERCGGLGTVILANTIFMDGSYHIDDTSNTVYPSIDSTYGVPFVETLIDLFEPDGNTYHPYSIGAFSIQASIPFFGTGNTPGILYDKTTNLYYLPFSGTDAFGLPTVNPVPPGTPGPPLGGGLFGPPPIPWVLAGSSVVLDGMSASCYKPVDGADLNPTDPGYDPNISETTSHSGTVTYTTHDS